MSIAAAFSNGKQALRRAFDGKGVIVPPAGKPALRRGAFALVTAAALFGANAAQAAQFTEHECRLISVTTREVVKALGVDTLSVEFRRSLAGFMAPDGKTLTCAGPTQIVTPTEQDIAAFNTIGGLLPFDIQARGVRQVAQLSSPAPASLALQ